MGARRMSERGPVAEALEQALFLIADEKCWTRGTFARRRDGESTAPWRPDAVRFCAIGAVEAVVGHNGPERPVLRLLSEFASGHREDDRCWVTLSAVNDSASHADIVSIFVDALEYAEEEGL